MAPNISHFKIADSPNFIKITSDISISYLNEIVSFINLCYRGETSLEGWTSEADFLSGQRIDLQMLQELLQKKDSEIFVLNDITSSHPIASFLLEYPTSDQAYIGMISVHPHAQNLGLGKKILKDAEKKVFAKNRMQLKLTVLSPRVELMNYYIRQGFHKTGVSFDFPGDKRYGLPKVKNLQLVEFVKTLSS